MEKTFIIACFIFLSNIMYAQIGVNTETPIGVFHVHSKSAGKIDLSNDVIVTNEGNVSIGGYPLGDAKLQIYATDEGSSALRLIDGNEGVNKVLGSKDALGNIGWITPEATFAQVINISEKKSYSNTGGFNFLTWNVPITGDYLVIIRWWGTADLSTAAPGMAISAYFELSQEGGTTSGQRDRIEYYIPYSVKNGFFTLTMPMHGNFQAGSRMVIKINPATPIGTKYNWNIGAYAAVELNPSVVIIKI